MPNNQPKTDTSLRLVNSRLCLFPFFNVKIKVRKLPVVVPVVQILNNFDALRNVYADIIMKPF